MISNNLNSSDRVLVGETTQPIDDETHRDDTAEATQSLSSRSVTTEASGDAPFSPEEDRLPFNAASADREDEVDSCTSSSGSGTQKEHGEFDTAQNTQRDIVRIEPPPPPAPAAAAATIHEGQQEKDVNDSLQISKPHREATVGAVSTQGGRKVRKQTAMRQQDDEQTISHVAPGAVRKRGRILGERKTKRLQRTEAGAGAGDMDEYSHPQTSPRAAPGAVRSRGRKLGERKSKRLQREKDDEWVDESSQPQTSPPTAPGAVRTRSGMIGEKQVKRLKDYDCKDDCEFDAELVEDWSSSFSFDEPSHRERFPFDINTQLHLEGVVPTDDNVVLGPPNPTVASGERRVIDVDDLIDDNNDNGLQIAHPVTDVSNRDLQVAMQVDTDELARTRLAAARKKELAAFYKTFYGGILGAIVVVSVVIFLIYHFISGNDHREQGSHRKQKKDRSDMPIEDYVWSLLPEYTTDNIDTTNLISPSPQTLAYKWILKDPNVQDYAEWRIVQRYALATFFYSTGGNTSWIDKGKWLSYEDHENDWKWSSSLLSSITDYSEDFALPEDLYELLHGSRHDEFRHLWLFNMGLKGSIPKEIGLLTSLRFIDLTSNKVQGTLPETLGNCIQLALLGLDANELTGTIPSELGLASNIGALTIMENNLQGSIPTELGLINLFALRLDYNRLR
jgi:hypothetical protein